MASLSRKEARLLDRDEQDLVAQTQLQALGNLSEGDLSGVVDRLRERRRRARETMKRQRREMRGKASPSGQRPASDNAGSAGKEAVLTTALRRASKELQRREKANAREELMKNASRALRLKKSADRQSRHPASRTAGQGMHPIPDHARAPSGALNEEGQRPVLERSRKVR